MGKLRKSTFPMIPSFEGIKKERSISESGLWRSISLWFRRMMILAFNLLINHDWVLFLIGIINKRVGFIESVFLMYPAHEEYALSYVFRRRLPKVKWSPWPVGLFYQNGRFGIKFVISASNRQFQDPTNKHHLSDVAKRMEKIRELLCAERKTFAGILPGVLYVNRIIRETYEAEVTVKAVLMAIEKIRSDENLPYTTPIIVLGGRGFIGRRVVAALPDDYVHVVDIGGREENKWPDHLKGQKVLLVNIALPSALDDYLHLLWPEMVLVNEVYPEPSIKTSLSLMRLGCRCYHIAGVKATSFPSFPLAYRGGIPCCAAWLSNRMEVEVLRIF